MLNKAVHKRFKGLARSRVSGLALCSAKVGGLMFDEGEIDPFWNGFAPPEVRGARFDAGEDGTV